MKYPSVLLLTSDDRIDAVKEWIYEHATELECTVHASSDPNELSRLFDQTYHVLVSHNTDHKVINDHIADRMRNQWIEFDPLELTPADFSHRVNSCFAHYLIHPDRTKTRPIFSVFTTTYNTGNKIYRAYNSLLKQTMRDWEWVVVDDSPDDENFFFLRNVLDDPRVRLYRRSKNSGSIGNVKNEAVSLCRGKYVLELDHDDEIMPSLLEEAAEVMDADPDVGFVYSDFYNVYEPDMISGEKANFKYSDFISYGYGGYYCIYVPEDKAWRYVYITPNVNNITASALISLPNHPRIWRKTVLDRAGNYSENLPICDDMEILIRTFALMDPATSNNPIKIVKIHKPLYVQYMNAGGNNFSLIRNREINRIGPQYLYPLLYKQYNMHDVFQRADAYEDPMFLTQHSQIWKRANAEYEHKYANAVVNRDVQQHLCILGLRQLLARKEGETHEDVMNRIDKLRDLHCVKTELIVLDRERTPEELCSQLEVLGLTNARAYAMEDCSWEDLERFAERMMCIPNNELHIIGPPAQPKVASPLPNVSVGTPIYSKYQTRHDIINRYCNDNARHSEPGGMVFETSKYLEIGVEWGYTYRQVISDNKTGVDPSPKWDDGKSPTPGGVTFGTIVRKTSDAFFASISSDTKFDVIFIDGMHHAENVWRDLRNSLLHLEPGGVILIDDVLPQTEEEQWRIPLKHMKEDGILKYAGTPWTGDVWKAIYVFMQTVQPRTEEYRIYAHPTNYRGVLALKPTDETEWVLNMPEEVPMEAYVVDYTQDYAEYMRMLYRDEV